MARPWVGADRRRELYGRSKSFRNTYHQVSHRATFAGSNQASKPLRPLSDGRAISGQTRSTVHFGCQSSMQGDEDRETESPFVHTQQSDTSSDPSKSANVQSPSRLVDTSMEGSMGAHSAPPENRPTDHPRERRISNAGISVTPPVPPVPILVPSLNPQPQLQPAETEKLHPMPPVMSIPSPPALKSPKGNERQHHHHHHHHGLVSPPTSCMPLRSEEWNSLRPEKD